VPAAAQLASWERRGVVAFLAIGVVVGIVAILTASRAGWVGLGVAGLVGVVAMVANRDRRDRLRALVGGGGPMLTGSKVVLGIAGLAWLVLTAGRSTDPVRRRWAWLTGLGLIYFGVHDLLDFYPNMPAALFAAALPLALLDAGTNLEAKPSFGRARLPSRLPR